jgi:hypothetical protein
VAVSLLTTGITILDTSAREAPKEPTTQAEKLVAADEEMARRMQAKLDVEGMAGGRWGSGEGGGARALRCAGHC